MEINGIGHIILTVSNYESCEPFYERFLSFLGLKQVLKMDGYLYYVGGRTAVGITRAEERYRGERFVQMRIGLHHFCLRARERADVDECFRFAEALGAKIVHPPEDGPFAPGYYSVLFEDPDGIRIEVNHVPGRGLLAEPRS